MTEQTLANMIAELGFCLLIDLAADKYVLKANGKELTFPRGTRKDAPVNRKAVYQAAVKNFGGDKNV